MDDDDDIELSRTMHLPLAESLGDSGEQRLPVLVVLRGEQVGRRYLLNESGLVIGRSAARAGLLIPGDPQISSVHCRFERCSPGDTWQVVDLASTNGTLLGGEPITSATLRDGDRIVVGTTVLKFTFHDELEDEYHRHVDQLMNIDDLTGLPVQRVYQTAFQEVILGCTRRNQPMGVLMMDMDGLKRINDTHGHQLGSHTIATVGRRLGAIVQEAAGTVSRFGGDEFSAFLPGTTREAALRLGESLRAVVADEPIRRETIEVSPTISIGLAMFPEHGRTAKQLTRAADEALYRAKAAGRNCVSE